MKGRSCTRTFLANASIAERRSCRNLCRSCGFKVKKYSKEVKRRCNCTFSWCCEVKCDTCTERVEEFFCDWCNLLRNLITHDVCAIIYFTKPLYKVYLFIIIFLYLFRLELLIVKQFVFYFTKCVQKFMCCIFCPLSNNNTDLHITHSRLQNKNYTP